MSQNEHVKSKDRIKALGVQVYKKLEWDNQVLNIKKTIISVIGGIKMI